MATNGKDQFISWLRDAHAMEVNLEKVLSKQADHASEIPHLRSRIEQHVAETRHHAELVERALDRHGEKPSGMKDMTGKIQGAMHGMFTGSSGDTPVKDTLSGIAAEHFEIACYNSLHAAARAIGDEQTALMCEEILRDEHAMADFLEHELPEVTRTELTHAR